MSLLFAGFQGRFATISTDAASQKEVCASLAHRTGLPVRAGQTKGRAKLRANALSLLPDMISRCKDGLGRGATYVER
jgi:hypothetical protein